MKDMNSINKNNISELTKLARKFNCFYLSGLHQGICKPFLVAGHQVGLVRPDILKHLQRFPEVFRITGKVVELNPAFRDYQERTSKVAGVLQGLRKENELCALKGWRDECFEVSTLFHHESLLEMDRSATCLFGIRNYGVSVNGYLFHPVKGLCIWLQQRSFTKQTWPGKWDCFVSGGLAVGYGILETCVKEVAEEASVMGELVKKLVPAGCVSFYFESERGLFPNTEYVYDLELPLDFVPKNADGEVETFELLTAEECVQRALSPHFKTTSAPVLMDFLIRRGYINPENEPNYRYIVELLHVPLQTIYNWPHSDISSNGDVQSLEC
ncbi:uncharacterized protein LOC113393172 [Vanessa tameamea]|uniref:Uncharacterized protein LOC113393172 n=1 Tax=Vanessa tameamea TaxID=334116 RepID=A0A8B8HMC7_VANTA|nr:uncharacterized protein YJR142W [Vanessa tameamea]XP_046960143.1 uncharacterized protein YJR142W [Vanessa cardui]XP_047526701.1 uncharacterized protein YJR142W [Vanessa atalanta]